MRHFGIIEMAPGRGEDGPNVQFILSKTDLGQGAKDQKRAIFCIPEMEGGGGLPRFFHFV